MNWTKQLLVLTAVAALGVGFAASTTFAAGPADLVGSSVSTAGVTPPEASRFDTVLDAKEMDETIDLAKHMEPYLSVGTDGLVHLKDATAAEIGVSEQFLANYRIALQESNKLITRGDITVGPDMSVKVTRKLPAPGIVLPSPGGANTEGVGAAADTAAVPDWGAWSYSSGAMFYNSYSTYTSYRNNYYNLCNSMASYIQRPWISYNLVNFYSYNQSYFNNYCYNPTGTYYYLPYSNSSSCSSSYYSPCYGNTVSYRPAYFWTRQYSYNSSCGCNSYNWAWQGFYTRY